MEILKTLGYTNNGKNKQITLSERQIFNLINIIEAYKEEMCASNQDIEECNELINILSK